MTASVAEAIEDMLSLMTESSEARVTYELLGIVRPSWASAATGEIERIAVAAGCDVRFNDHDAVVEIRRKLPDDQP